MEDHDLPRLFLVSPLVFTNLHFVYDYYPYWNGIFLICAFRWAILALIAARSRLAGFRIGAVVVFGDARSKPSLVLGAIDRFHLTRNPVYQDSLCTLDEHPPTAEPVSLR